MYSSFKLMDNILQVGDRGVGNWRHDEVQQREGDLTKAKTSSRKHWECSEPVVRSIREKRGINDRAEGSYKLSKRLELAIPFLRSELL